MEAPEYMLFRCCLCPNLRGLELYRRMATRKPHGEWAQVYILTNYDTTMDENLYRVYKLRDMGYGPYVMIYDKPRASEEIRKLQRWCNNKLMTTNYRKDEQEACRRLSQEKKEDGTPRFPKMESNANWWEKTIAEIAKIQKAIDDAPYPKEDTQ